MDESYKLFEARLNKFQASLAVLSPSLAFH